MLPCLPNKVVQHMCRSKADFRNCGTGAIEAVLSAASAVPHAALEAVIVLLFLTDWAAVVGVSRCMHAMLGR